MEQNEFLKIRREKGTECNKKSPFSEGKMDKDLPLATTPLFLLNGADLPIFFIRVLIGSAVKLYQAVF